MKWNISKWRTFCNANDPVKTVRIQLKEKIFVNTVSTKTLVSKIYIELSKLDKKTTKNIWKGTEHMCTDISKKTYKWPKSTEKYVQHH